MAETTYKIALTGEQINNRLQLIDGNSTSVKIETDEVTTNKGNLATEAYVDAKVVSGGGASSLADFGITATAEQINRTQFIDGGAEVLILKASAVIDGNGKQLATVKHTHTPDQINIVGAEEGQVLRVVNGQATWSTISTTDGSEGLIYVLNDDGVSYSVSEIGDCTDFDVVIPATYNNLPVTSINDQAFIDCEHLTSIVIPNSVTSICENAFAGCTCLRSVTIPDSVTSIGDSAFEDCSYLRSVIIPDSVAHLGNRAFGNCTSLTNVTIGNGVTFINDYTFCNCCGLTSIAIPNSVTKIGDYAFRYCTGLTSITIPDSVTSICEETFDGCTELTIYCETEEQPEDWNVNWNPNNRPVVWGAALSITAINDKLAKLSGGGTYPAAEDYTF